MRSAPELDERELAALWSESCVAGLRVYDDVTVTSSARRAAARNILSNASWREPGLHTGGITGRGVTVAVLDTGVLARERSAATLFVGSQPARVLAQHDVILARETPRLSPFRRSTSTAAT